MAGPPESAGTTGPYTAEVRKGEVDLSGLTFCTLARPAGRIAAFPVRKESAPVATLFPVDTFTGFGPTAARPAEFDPVLGRVKSRKEPKLRAGVRAAAPKVPGVYGMLGRHGELIYVGKAKSLRARLMSYFRDSRDPKAGRILQHTHDPRLGDGA